MFVNSIFEITRIIYSTINKNYSKNEIFALTRIIYPSITDLDMKMNMMIKQREITIAKWRNNNRDIVRARLSHIRDFTSLHNEQVRITAVRKKVSSHKRTKL